MPRICTVCAHPKRDEIASRLVSGESMRGIARQYGLSGDAVGRHQKNCIRTMLAQAKEEHASDLQAEIADLQKEARELGALAKTKGDLKTALLAVDKLTRLAELLGRARGELQPTTQVQVAVQVNQAPESSPAELRHLAAVLVDIAERSPGAVQALESERSPEAVQLPSPSGDHT